MGTATSVPDPTSILGPRLKDTRELNAELIGGAEVIASASKINLIYLALAPYFIAISSPSFLMNLIRQLGREVVVFTNVKNLVCEPAIDQLSVIKDAYPEHPIREAGRATLSLPSDRDCLQR